MTLCSIKDTIYDPILTGPWFAEPGAVYIVGKPYMSMEKSIGANSWFSSLICDVVSGWMFTRDGVQGKLTIWLLRRHSWMLGHHKNRMERKLRLVLS
jgi:hypothetical protein